MTELDKLIGDLDYLEKTFDKQFQQKYDDIMAEVMSLIGRTTAYDTGVSRQIIKDILGDLGRPDLVAELEHNVYEFWKTKAEREQEGHSYTLIKNNGSYSIDIFDDAIANQNDGVVSEIHPRQDPEVVPYHIDLALDKLETKIDPRIESAFIALEDSIVKAIEGGMR